MLRDTEKRLSEQERTNAKVAGDVEVLEQRLVALQDEVADAERRRDEAEAKLFGLHEAIRRLPSTESQSV